MNQGLLWFDPDPRDTPQAKLAAAAARYAERFGRPPNCCHVHPDHLFVDPAFTIVPNPAVRPDYFWVGHDETLVVRRPRKRSA